MHIDTCMSKTKPWRRGEISYKNENKSKKNDEKKENKSKETHTHTHNAANVNSIED